MALVARGRRLVGRAWLRTLRLRRFVLVGAGNTVLDYALFVALATATPLPLSWVWVAKAISGTVAMAVSYYLNRAWVFGAGPATARQAGRFLLTTLVGVYAIQTPLTQVFTTIVPQLGEAAYDHILFRLDPVTEPFSVKTVAFVVATVPSLAFNFLLYRLWVFTERAPARR